MVKMGQTSRVGLDKYLSPSPLSDYNNARLKSTAKEMITSLESPAESAHRIFDYVRDEKSDLVLMEHWIVGESRTFSHYEEVVGLAGEEGMPPKFFCKTLEWLPAFFSSRRTEKVRGL